MVLTHVSKVCVTLAARRVLVLILSWCFFQLMNAAFDPIDPLNMHDYEPPHEQVIPACQDAVSPSGIVLPSINEITLKKNDWDCRRWRLFVLKQRR